MNTDETLKAAAERAEIRELTKDMSPFGAALFGCFSHEDQAKQLEALSNLQKGLKHDKR